MFAGRVFRVERNERPRVQDNTYVCAERSYVPGMHLYYWPRTRTRGEGSMNLYSYVYGHVPFWLKLSQVYIRWKSIGSRQFSWGREPVLVQHIVTNFFDSLVHGALWCFIYWPTDILKYCIRSWRLTQMFSELCQSLMIVCFNFKIFRMVERWTPSFRHIQIYFLATRSFTELNVKLAEILISAAW